MIPYNRQYIDKADIKNVKNSLKAKLITTGKYNKKFETLVSRKFSCKFSSIVNSGTAALHLSFLAINIKKNDIIIMPAINFISSYNLCKRMGAKIFFADVDKLTGQMTPQLLLECVKKNNIKKIKAVITMYLGGSANHVNEFYQLKKKFKFFLIEDACHAIGSNYIINKKKYNVGSSTHSDLCVFSLHAIKTITTGEGGIICTNNKLLFDKIISLKSHGIKRDIKKRHWKYDVIDNGFNYRLSDINCALGISQLSKLSKFVKKRKRLAKNYINLLKNKNLILFPRYSQYSSYHLFIININFSKLKKNKDFFMDYLIKNKIMAQYHYIPIYKFSLFKDKKIILNNTELYFKNSVSIPLYYKLSLNKQKYIVNKILTFIKQNKV